MRHKVIIACTVTGSVHTPAMSPYLPITPEQIAREAIAAARAGASVLNLHGRNPADGRPSVDPAVYRQFLGRIHAETDAVINLTTGGTHTTTLAQRLAAAIDVSPEMASCNLGLMNVGVFSVLEKIEKWKYAWESAFLKDARDAPFRNTITDVQEMFETVAQPHATRFEFECHDIGNLYTLAHFVKHRLLRRPFIQFVLSGVGSDPENLTHMKRTADKLFGSDYQWSVLGAGRRQITLVTQAALMGGHVRVGLGDSIYLGHGELATSNADQVRLIRGIVESLGLQIATPTEARALLKVKGKAAVKL